MRRFELLIPPPIIVLLVGLMMWLSSMAFPGLTSAWRYTITVAVVTGLLGIAISLAGMVPFVRARTTMDPKHPGQASTLITSGIYHYSRNPMYLGVLLVLVAWAVYLGNLLSVLWILVFIVYITRFQIIPEERLLQEKFGAAFTQYKSKARRWV